MRLASRQAIPGAFPRRISISGVHRLLPRCVRLLPHYNLAKCAIAGSQGTPKILPASRGKEQRTWM